jgi:cephalosporin hydroxylase
MNMRNTTATVRQIARDVRDRKGKLGLPDAREIASRAIVTWPPVQRQIADAFHRLYYYNPEITWYETRWLGHEVRKLPLDLWTYQEILHDVQPDLIIETGTRFGGSALFMANLCDIIGHGEVISVDIAADKQPVHPRITYLDGSSTDQSIVETVRTRAADAKRVMVILDSDHREPHVTAEIAAYKDLVTPGSYLIVEDSNTGGHPVHNVEVPDGGPMAAIQQLLATDSRFQVDTGRERYFVTMNPSGYLRRTS